MNFYEQIDYITHNIWYDPSETTVTNKIQNSGNTQQKILSHQNPIHHFLKKFFKKDNEMG